MGNPAGLLTALTLGRRGGGFQIARFATHLANRSSLSFHAGTCKLIGFSFLLLPPFCHLPVAPWWLGHLADGSGWQPVALGDFSLGFFEMPGVGIGRALKTTARLRLDGKKVFVAPAAFPAQFT